MAEPPRRGGPPPKGNPPSPRVTMERVSPVAPRTTAPMGTVRAKEIADKILAEDETHADPGPTVRQPKFLPEELIQTTLSPSQQLRERQLREKQQQQQKQPPQRQRVTTPMVVPKPPERPRVATPPVAITQPERARITTPMGTAQSEPIAVQPSVIVSPQQMLTREVPPELLKQLAAQGAAEVHEPRGPREPQPREPQPREPVRGDVRLTVATQEVRRTPVWVATHRPPEPVDARLFMVRAPDSPAAASFRVLRHRLQERNDPRVIAVTSAAPREGKTTCAVNLALALGECGRARVLLVEANLRTPALAPLFGFMPPQCFSVQMQKHKDKPMEGWSVVEVFSEYLHVLAVEPGDRGRPLLDGPAFAIAMEMLAQAGYDYIVIDTPPVLGAADVNLIEDSADGILVTAWARTTSSRLLRQAIDQLAQPKFLGVTLLDV